MYRWLEHTAELELRIEADSEEQVFADALGALRELLGGAAAGPALTREVEVAAPDRATLLAEWLQELVFLAETEGLVPERARSLELDGDGLHAVVEGRRGEPPHLVKAVTYHGLALEHDGARFHARLVLDV